MYPANCQGHTSPAAAIDMAMVTAVRLAGIPRPGEEVEAGPDTPTITTNRMRTARKAAQRSPQRVRQDPPDRQQRPAPGQQGPNYGHHQTTLTGINQPDQIEIRLDEIQQVECCAR